MQANSMPVGSVQPSPKPPVAQVLDRLDSVTCRLNELAGRLHSRTEPICPQGGAK